MRSTKDGPFPFHRATLTLAPLRALWRTDGVHRLPGLSSFSRGRRRPCSLWFTGIARLRSVHHSVHGLAVHGVGLRAYRRGFAPNCGKRKKAEKSRSARLVRTVEFPCPALCSTDLSADARFARECGIHMNFTCPLTKIGGHLQWIQSGTSVPQDRLGVPMHYVGQFTSTDDLDLGDGGIVYIFLLVGDG